MPNQEKIQSAKSFRDLRNALDDRPHFEEAEENIVRPASKVQAATVPANRVRAISATVWGAAAFIAVVIAAGMASPTFEANAAAGAGRFVGAAAVMLGIIYLLHKATCAIFGAESR